MSEGTGGPRRSRQGAGCGAGSAPARTGDELRALAWELAEGLSERGLTLLEVERVAAMMVDRFRRLGQSRGPDGAGPEGTA